MFLKILQNLQEKTTLDLKSLFTKVAGLKRLQHKYFLMNFEEFSRTPLNRTPRATASKRFSQNYFVIELRVWGGI